MCISAGGAWNDGWKIKPPTKAFVGIGVVDPDSSHWITDRLRTASERASVTSLPNPYSILSNLLTPIQQVSLPCFGDVANRLFAALPIVVDRRLSPTLRRGEIPLDCDESTLANHMAQYQKIMAALQQVNA